MKLYIKIGIVAVICVALFFGYRGIGSWIKAGAEKDKYDNEFVYLGKFKSGEVLPTSFNEYPKMKIVTDKGIFFVRGIYSCQFGEDIYFKRKGVL